MLSTSLKYMCDFIPSSQVGGNFNQFFLMQITVVSFAVGNNKHFYSHRMTLA